MSRVKVTRKEYSGVDLSMESGRYNFSGGRVWGRGNRMHDNLSITNAQDAGDLLALVRQIKTYLDEGDVHLPSFGEEDEK